MLEDFPWNGDSGLKNNDLVGSARSFWDRIPEQMRRLPILAVIVIAALIAVRVYLVPGDFGEYGHYRGSAMADAASLEIMYG